MTNRMNKGGANMRNRYIVFDVETPNRLNDRISAIGITVIEDGRIINEFYSLINPETKFDLNIRLTGITPESVLDRPTFQEIWNTIQPGKSSTILSVQFILCILINLNLFPQISAHMPFISYGG